MEEIKVLVVEDQVLIAESITVLLEKHSLWVVGTCRSGEEALKLVREHSPDLVLMDIKLAGKMDGIAAARTIQNLLPIPIIYLTDLVDPKTFERARDTHPASYLSKPFNDADLVRAIDLAIHNRQQKKTIGIEAKEQRPLTDSIFLKLGSQKYVKLPYQEIEYLEADRSYCKVVTSTITHTVSISMNHVYEQLDPTTFIRVHRSFVVNLKKIKEVEGNLIRLEKHTVQMAGEYREDLLRQLNFLK